MRKALIADDHPIFRNGLKLVLSYELDMYVAEATDGMEALAYIDSNEVDLVIVDIDLPGVSGLDVVRHIRKKRLSVPVLVVSALPEQEYAERARRAGASGFLNKQSDKLSLLGAVRALFREQHRTKASTTDHGEPEGGQDAVPDEGPPHKRLSDREYQVFCMLASGRTVGEIAEQLCLSDKTVSTHRTRILRKLDLSTNAELTGYALRHELIRLV